MWFFVQQLLILTLMIAVSILVSFALGYTPEKALAVAYGATLATVARSAWDFSDRS